MEIDTGSSEAGPKLSTGSYEQRYRAQDFIGEGGMGKVFQGRDTVLFRDVAIKYLKEPTAGKARFWQEIRNSGVLDHPCIPPIYDVGIDSSGRLFYVMRLIRGRSLREVLSGDSGWSLPQLLQGFMQVCGAVQFAHDKGILHLDLKPDNIMVGEYREIYLVDWGVSELAPQLGVSVQERQTRPQHRGTPAYMSPEQARGDSHLTTAADVFALGIVLFEILTRRKPFVGAAIPKLLHNIEHNDFDRNETWRRSPQELRELIESCLAKDASERIASARGIAQQIQDYLEGHKEQERRRQSANASVAAAERELEERSRLLQRLEQHRLERQQIHVEPWGSAQEKRPLWRVEDSIVECQRGADVAAERALRFFNDAREQLPHDAAIRRSLAELYWERFQRAELESEEFQIRFLEAQLRQLDLPEVNSWLQGEGTLTIVCTPTPTRVALSRLVEVDRVLIPGGSIDLPTPQLEGVPLPMGRYHVRLERDGFRTLEAPISVGRNEKVVRHWTLRTEREIGDNFVQVPPGPFVMGGDDATFESVERQVRVVGEFFIARFPVTWSEYRDFLQAIADRDLLQARRRLPLVSHRDPDLWRIDDEGHVRFESKTGEWPIFQVTYRDAKDYCRWKSEIDNRQYHLPTDEEWEKAARGEDGRRFPWGDRFDASFCKNAQSTESAARPEEVGRYLQDCSPYGARDMAGGIREWCDSWFDDRERNRLVRGGSWNFGPIGAHCAYRLGCGPDLAYPFIGFRLVHRV